MMAIKILITGANSYVGTSFEKWLSQWPDKYHVDTIDMIDGTWRQKSFAGYDAVFHVAGIAHVSADPSKKDLYYKINRDLAIETAGKAKADGAKQFVFMSSMIIYGADEPVGKEKVITKDTIPVPADFYGDSKLQADLAIQELADDSFTVSIMRPPVIYGPGCKGNFPKLLKLAKYAFIFPNINNRRSMIYIDNFCECVRQIIDENKGGIFFPQNEEYVSTKDVIVKARKLAGRGTLIIPIQNIICTMFNKNRNFRKAFGSKVYAKELSHLGIGNKYGNADYSGLNYQEISFVESLKRQDIWQPFVSVIMATYNDEPYHLKLAIDSIINQTYSSFELIIVDDSTRYDSKSVIDSYARDKRVRILRGESKLGFVPSLNYGLSCANGSLIARMDGDDISVPNRFALQVEYFNAHPRCDILGGQIDIIDEIGNLTGKRRYPLGGVKLWCFFLFRTPLAHPAVMFRRKIVDAGYHYDVCMKKAEDVDFWIRLHHDGYRIENVRDVLLQFRIDSSFVQKRVYNKEQEDYVIKSRKRNFSFKRPIFSLADYMAATIRRIVPDSIKAKQYQRENGE